MNKFFRMILCVACCGTLFCVATACREEVQKKETEVVKEKLYNEKEVRILLQDNNTPEMILADYADKMTYDGISYLAANGLKLNPELVKRSVIKGSLPVLVFLLERDFKIDETNGNADQLAEILFNKGCSAEVAILIKKGVKPTEKMFLQSCARQDVNIIRIMLESKVNVNAKDENLSSALHIAVTTRNLNLVKMLVAAGADLTAQDKNGKTAIDLADTDELRQYFKTLNTTTESK